MVPVSKSRLLIIELASFVLAFTLLLFLTSGVKKKLLQAAEGLKDATIAAFETRYGLVISYDSIGPSIFSTIDIRNIKIQAMDDRRQLIQIERLRLGYSLLQVLQGNLTDSLRSVRIEKPVLSIDAERDLQLIQNIAGSSAAATGETFLLTDLISRFSFKTGIQFRLLKGDVALTSGQTKLVLRYVNLSGTALKDKVIIKSSFNIRLDTNEPMVPSISSTFDLQGSLSLANLSGTLNATIARLQSPLLSMKTIGIHAIFTKDKVEIYKKRDWLPYTFSLSYAFSDRLFQGSLQFGNFVPRSLVATGGALKNLDPWLDINSTGTLQFSYTPGNELEYGANLSARIPLPWKDTQASISVTGMGSAMKISSLSLESSHGIIQYSGAVDITNRSLNGNLALVRVLSPTGVPIDGTFTITTRGSEYYVFGESFSVGDFLCSAVDAHVTINIDTYTWDLSALHFVNEESYENVRVSRLFSSGVYTSIDNLVQGSIKLDNLDLTAIKTVTAAFLSGIPDIPQNLLEQTTVSTEIFVTTDGRHLSYSSPRFILALNGENQATMIASIAGTERQVSLQNGQLIMKDLAASFTGLADFSDPQDIKIDANLLYENIEYPLKIAILDQNNITLQGSYGLSGSMLRTDDGFWSGYCKADGFPIPINKNRMLVSFDTGFKFLSENEWSVNLYRLELQDIPSFTPMPLSVSCSGQVGPKGVQLSDLLYEDSGGSLSGTLAATWAAGFSNIKTTVRLADNQKNERYELDLTLILPGEIDGRVYMARANLDRFYPTQLTPQLTGEVRFSLTSFDHFSIDWKIASLQLRWMDQDVLLVSSGSLTPDSLELLNNSITVGQLQADISSLEMSRKNNRMNLASRIRGILGSRSIDVSNNIAIQFSDIPAYQDIVQKLNSIDFNGTIQLMKGHYDTWTIKEPIVFAFNKSKQGFSLQGGPQNALRLELGGDGAFYMAFSQPLPVRGAVTGSILKGLIDASTRNLYIDISALWDLMPKGLPLQITSGFGLANLSVQGPLSDPVFTGSATASSVRMRIPDWLEDEVGPTELSFMFEENTLRLAKTLVPVGNGKIQIAGSLSFEQWLPGNFSLTAMIPEQAPIAFKSQLLGLNARGKVWGGLGLASQDGAFSVNGKLVAFDTMVMYSGSPQQEVQNQNQNLRFKSAITLQTGKKVEFIWPNTNFPVLRAYTDTGSIIQVNSDSETGRFSLNGNISLRGGEVFYFQRSFYIRSGQLAFNENEIRFDPRIALRAEIRDRTANGPVTISLIIDNAPLSNFTPRFISEPPLSQIDIFALLGQNVLGSETANTASSLQDAVLSASSDLLAQFNVVRVFEQNIRDTLSLDMFSIRTQVLQNALLQASGLVSTPVDRTASLGNYFDNTTLYLGKYFGPDFFVQSMVSLRYDPEKENSLFGGLTVEPEVGAELRSPLFTVNWNFVPKAGDPLFIKSQSVTISWKWSF